VKSTRTKYLNIEIEVENQIEHCEKLRSVKFC